MFSAQMGALEHAASVVNLSIRKVSFGQHASADLKTHQGSRSRGCYSLL